MSIKVNELVKSNKLSKVSNGVNIFNAMKAEFNKNPLTRQFELDFAGIVVATPVVFQEIKKKYGHKTRRKLCSCPNKRYSSS